MRDRVLASLSLGISIATSLLGCSDAPPRTDPPPAATSPKVNVARKAAQAEGPDRPPVASSASVAWTTITDASEATRAVRTAARSAKRSPVVYIGATWCGPCKVYKARLDDPRMVQAHRTVHIIELDADLHMGTLEALGITPAGVPHWEKVDTAGRATGTAIDGRAWKENTIESMAPALEQFFAAN